MIVCLNRRSSGKTAKVYPFASQKKTMSTVIKLHDGSAKTKEQKDYRVLVKGKLNLTSRPIIGFDTTF